LGSRRDFVPERARV